MSTADSWRALTQQGTVWAFDVDGTLIGSVRSDVLRPGAMVLLDELTRRGVTCVLWSAGGHDHAHRMAVAHGLDHMIAACYSKHDRDSRSRYVVDHFAAAHHPQVFVDDAPEDLPTETTVVAVPQFIGGNPADRALWAMVDQLTGGAP